MISSHATNAKLLELNQNLKGEISGAETDRLLYSTDASIYQRQPLAVARPANRDDCWRILEFARQHQIALIPRAAGTSLAGQVVGEAIIVDVSRHMTHIITVDTERQTAWVEPGVILERLNQHVQPMGLKFAPDPSTLNRCTVSGVIGNNAWGAHAPVYGSTRNHILEIELLLPNGDILHTQPLDDKAFANKLKLSNCEGDIYRCINAVMQQHRPLIQARFPNKNDVICNAGYALHELAAMRPWNPHGPEFNLSALICGSEGTLGLITQAKVKLISSPKHSTVIGVHFHSIDEALRAVVLALRHGACAAELLDEYLLNLTLHNPEQTKNRFWVQGKPNAILLIEIYGKTKDEISDRTQQLINDFKSQQFGYAYSVIENEKVPQVWSMRRAALGLLMGMQGAKKAVSFIEDSAVPVRHLPEFVRQVRSLMQHHGTPCVYYGSVSMGLIHLRPLLNLNQNQDRQTFKTLADEVAQLLMHFNGTMSAKHGDGIVRSPYIETFFGSDIVQCFETIKSSFDPNGILNPHKIVHPEPIDRNLRFLATTINNLSTGFDWAPEGLLAAVEQCNGAGACRKLAGNDTMCPSYMATGEELHSTRGRANTLRQALQQHQGFNQNALAVIHNALQYCLSCKGCRLECPANVDMAKLKAECLHQTHKLNGTPLRTTILSHLHTISRIGSRLPDLSNRIARLPGVHSLLGFSSKRQLPKLATKRFSQWFNTHTAHKNAGLAGHIVLLNDLFTDYYDETLGRSAVEMLERWGFNITVSPCFASPRLSISLGLLDQAQARMTVALDWLQTQVNENTHIIGLEPSELLTYRDEARVLPLSVAQRAFLDKHQHQFMLFDEFVSNHRQSFPTDITYKTQPLDIALHVHCHQKSLSNTEHCVTALHIIPHANIQRIPSGCCGMAGFFGYEKQNHELSHQIGELVLLPFIRKLPPQTKIVATGASCRQQIQDFLHIKAYHPAEILYQQLADD
jgi:FAD/FMN-containing dehydrogenase/Fe-S oxidoreductase